MKKPYYKITKYDIRIGSTFIMNLSIPTKNNPLYFKNLSESLEVFEQLKDTQKYE